MEYPKFLKQWRMAVFFFVPLIMLPFPLVQGTKLAGTAYVLIVNIIFYLTLPLPLCMSTLIPLVLYPLLGVHSAATVASWCVNDASLMLIGNMIFGMAIEGANLHNRIALKTLLFLGPKPEKLLLAFMAVSFVLSMWIANIGVVVMLLPIIFAIQKELNAMDLSTDTAMMTSDPPLKGVEEFRKTVKRITPGMILSVMYGSTMGGMTTLVGSHPSMMFKLVLDQLYGDVTGVNFASHMLVCTPLAICAAFLTWLLLTYTYAPGFVSQLWRKRVITSQQETFEEHLTKNLKEQHRLLGNLSFGEWSVVAIFFMMVFLWFFRSPPGFAGWSVLFVKGYVSDATVAMFFALILFIWPTDLQLLLKEGKNIPIVQWKPHMTQRFPWELVFFNFGSNILSKGTEAGGLADWIASVLQPLDVVQPWIILLIIIFIVAILTEFIGNSVLVVILLPILAKFAERSGVNPIYYMLPTTLSAVLSFMTPVASNITALIHSSGAVSVPQMAKSGLIPKFVCLILIAIFMNTVAEAVYGVHTFPSWASTNRTMDQVPKRQ